MTDPVMAHVRHLRAARFCMSGARDWFTARGWDWSHFVTHGRVASDFSDTGCPLAAKVAEKAIEEAADGQG